MTLPVYSLDDQGRCVIDQYNESSLFSSFLPGIAGENGIPLWAFYVNRGQGVVSFGIRNKDAAILEFFPADKAYQLVTLRGFRTFLKVHRGSKTAFHEPFQRNDDQNVHQRMIISSHEVAVEETNKTLGLKVRAEMFTLPNASLGGLVRRLTVENISDQEISLEYVDGLPQLLSFGLNQWVIKNMSRTMEAFTIVDNLDQGAPFLRLKVLPADSEKIVPVVAGNFFVGYHHQDAHFGRTQAIVDSRIVFGSRADFTVPENFFSDKGFDASRQVSGNRNPAGFLTGHGKLAPKGRLSVLSLYGHAGSLSELNDFLAANVTDATFFDRKQDENARMIRGISSRAFTATSHGILNEYARQSFLDNLLRGGLSVQVPGGPILYLFGRKHGDLERDYNEFFLQDSTFSEGNGDFRDVLQNRRCELFFNPAVGDRNIKYFFSLIQPDGYNPLVLRNTRFHIAEPKKLAADPELAPLLPALEPMFAQEFKYAALWSALADKLKDEADRARAAGKILQAAEEVEDAEFEKGYWSDHWTYLVDILENFRNVYPDRLNAALLSNNTYTFFDSTHFVLPREKKYVVTERGVRQYGAVAYNKEKDLLIKSRSVAKHRVRTKQGKGEVYRTTLLVKILTLVVNKLASLDAFLAGIEMEADRPGWCDALNGLPGLFGSALNESIELKRLVDFLLDALKSTDNSSSVPMPLELYNFLHALGQMVKNPSDLEKDPMKFWNESHMLKESYREKVFFGFDGAEKSVPMEEIKTLLTNASALLEKSLERGRDKSTGLYHTYFSHDPVAYERIGESDSPFARVKVFSQKPLPLFLEGIVHAMRVLKTPAETRAIYQNVLKTELYDKALGMYRMNAPLGDKAIELGRIAIFNYGWLENGSIFLHMHYKYVLEMIRGGMIDEFYANLSTLLVPFRDPKTYRRSVTENVSFMASSGYATDPGDHGKGFVARLSGSTVEFLHIWSILMFGGAPFRLDDAGQLVFRLEPQLHKDFFTKDEMEIHPAPGEKAVLPKNALAFKFLGKTLVIYHNDARRDTFGASGARVQRYILEGFDGKSETVKNDHLVGKNALAIREGRIKTIHAYLG